MNEQMNEGDFILRKKKPFAELIVAFALFCATILNFFAILCAAFLFGRKIAISLKTVLTKI